nr:hypothetical protein [Candidatus Prometheoarchaeum syntrophicum]QEE16332.1 hypothetical protein DSAG12_02162 [Candidatus Prometheoarchaeum syntrophicum]
MEKIPKKTLNYDPLEYKDYFKSPIRKSIFGYLLSLIGIIWIYALALPHIKPATLAGMSGVLIILNLFVFFSDQSLHFSPKFFGRSIQRVHLPSLRTYIAEISLDPARSVIKHPSQPVHPKNGNLMLFSNRSNHKVVAVMGLALRSTALHIQSNFENFLRVLYSLKTNIPLTFQIDLKNVEADTSNMNSIYGDRIKNLKNETVNRDAQTVFEYTIFITRTYRFPSKHTIDNLLYTMKQSYISILNVLETNFAHFKFSALFGGELINSLRGSITGKRYEHIKKDSILNSPPNQKGWILWIRPILGFLGNLGVLWYLTYRIDNRILYFIMIFLSLILCLLMVLNFWWNNFLEFHDANFSMIDMFPSGEFLYHKLGKSLHFYDYFKKKIYSKLHYSMTTFNKAFLFNQVKFYRSLLHHVVSGNFSVSIQFHTRRISSMNRFKQLLSSDFWEKWSEKPHLRNSLERKNCGFYFFQPIFSIGMVRDQNVVEVSDKDLITNSKILQNTFLPLFEMAFPNCGIVSIKPNIIYQYLTKARLYSTFNSLLNLHFTTGISLVPFIALPEEIHKFLPINYAGEFSTPLLQDEIIFGHAFNPENISLETPGGISFNELQENVLFLGESYKNTQKGLIRCVAELLAHRFPCLIFDWDGTWKHLVGHLEKHNTVNNITYLTAGENIGIELFDLPHNQRGPTFISYISSIIDVFGRVFHYHDGQLALLKSAWGSVDHTTHITISAVCDKISIEGDGIKNYYKNQNPVYADLNMLQKDFLVKTFDTPIQKWIPFDGVTDNASTLIINLEILNDNNIKNLFIQAFLAQYQYIYEMDLDEIKNQKRIPRTIVLPALDILFNNRIEMRQNTQVNSTLFQLIKQQHILVGAGTNISEIHPTVLNLFKNRFIFRTQMESNLRILNGFMNFDENFTNIQHLQGSSRKVSYQSHYLSTIDPDKCIVLRPKYITPYVFQFNLAKYFESPHMTRISATKIHDFQLTPPQLLDAEEITQPKTLLESDFPDTHINKNLLLFLRSSVLKLDQLPYLTKDQIVTHLSELFAENSHGELAATQKSIMGIFDNLRKLGYLVEEKTVGGKSFEITGYKLTVKARDCIKEDEFDQSEDNLIIIPDDSVIQEREPMKDPTVLPATIPPKNPPSQKIPNDEWMDEFDLELSEIIVPCRMLYEKGEFKESYEFLKAGWEKAMEKIENNPQTDGLIDKFRERYQWIKETDSTKEKNLLKLINRIEYFIISMV